MCLQSLDNLAVWCMTDWAQLENDAPEWLKLIDLAQQCEGRWKAARLLGMRRKRSSQTGWGRLRITFNNCKERQRFMIVGFLSFVLNVIRPKKHVTKLTLCGNFLSWKETW